MPASIRLQQRSTRGLTLIELIAVLLILVALSGIVVTLLPNFTAQAHTATGARNISEINSALQLHVQRFGSFPDNLDSLVDETDTAVVTYLEYSTGFVVEDLSDGTTDANGITDDRIIEALNDAGITTTHQMLTDASSVSATFDAYSGTAYTIDDTPQGTVVTIPDATATDNTLNLRAGTTYVVFGLGGLCDAIGQSITDAPVHFPEEGTPNETYHRFLLIFEIRDEGPAHFFGTAAMHEGGLDGVGHAMEEYFEVR